MFQMHRLLVAGAVVAGSLWFAPSFSSATTGGCLVPSAAVSQYMSSTGSNILNNLSSNLQICKNQCQEMRNGCDNVNKSAVRCVKVSSKADSQGQARACNELTGESKQACKEAQKSNQDAILSFLHDDRQSADSFCESQFQNCLASCGQSED